MSRADVINRCATLIEAKTYLEIGVEDGNTFRGVGIAKKYGVDPAFKVDTKTLSGEHFSMTSDEFFYQNGSMSFDIVFIDGLHTFEQSLADLLNAVMRLKPRGVIILDDVYPSDYFASLRDHARCRRLKELAMAEDRDWMGDVFKTVAFMHDMMPDLSYGTCDAGANHEVTVIWRDAPRAGKRLFASLADLSTMEYADLLDKIGLLKLMEFSDIIDRLTIAISPDKAA